MQHGFVIKGRLMGPNEYLKAERSIRRGYICGSDTKQRCQAVVSEAARHDPRIEAALVEEGGRDG